MPLSVSAEEWDDSNDNNVSTGMSISISNKSKSSSRYSRNDATDSDSGGRDHQDHNFPLRTRATAAVGVDEAGSSSYENTGDSASNHSTSSTHSRDDQNFYKSILQSAMGPQSIKAYEYLFIDEFGGRKDSDDDNKDNNDDADTNEDDDNFTNLVSSVSSRAGALSSKCSAAPSSITMPTVLQQIGSPRRNMSALPSVVVQPSTGKKNKGVSKPNVMEGVEMLIKSQLSDDASIVSPLVSIDHAVEEELQKVLLTTSTEKFIESEPPTDLIDTDNPTPKQSNMNTTRESAALSFRESERVDSTTPGAPIATATATATKDPNVTPTNELNKESSPSLQRILFGNRQMLELDNNDSPGQSTDSTPLSLSVHGDAAGQRATAPAHEDAHPIDGEHEPPNHVDESPDRSRSAGSLSFSFSRVSSDAELERFLDEQLEQREYSGAQIPDVTESDSTAKSWKSRLREVSARNSKLGADLSDLLGAGREHRMADKEQLQKEQDGHHGGDYVTISGGDARYRDEIDKQSQRIQQLEAENSDFQRAIEQLNKQLEEKEQQLERKDKGMVLQLRELEDLRKQREDDVRRWRWQSDIMGNQEFKSAMDDPPPTTPASDGAMIVSGEANPPFSTFALAMAKSGQEGDKLELELEQERRMALQVRVVELERELANARQVTAPINVTTSSANARVQWEDSTDGESLMRSKSLDYSQRSTSRLNDSTVFVELEISQAQVKETTELLKGTQRDLVQANKSMQKWKDKYTEASITIDDLERRMARKTASHAAELRQKDGELELLNQQVAALRRQQTKLATSPQHILHDGSLMLSRSASNDSPVLPFDEVEQDISNHPQMDQPSPASFSRNQLDIFTPRKQPVGFGNLGDISPIHPESNTPIDMSQMNPSFDVNSEDFDEYGDRISGVNRQEERRENESLNMDIDELMHDIRQMTMERSQLLEDINADEADSRPAALEANPGISVALVVNSEHALSESHGIVESYQHDGVICDRTQLLEREEATILQSRNDHNDESKLLDQTISLMENMIGLVHCEKGDDSINSREASVLDQLEVLSDLLNETDQQTSLDRISNILKGPSILERQQRQKEEERRIVVSTTTSSVKTGGQLAPAPELDESQATSTDHANSTAGSIHVWEELVNELRGKIAFLEYDRAEVVRVTKDIMEQELETHRLKICVVTATAQREAKEELLAFQRQTQQVLQNLYGSVCRNCQEKLRSGVV